MGVVRLAATPVGLLAYANPPQQYVPWHGLPLRFGRSSTTNHPVRPLRLWDQVCRGGKCHPTGASCEGKVSSRGFEQEKCRELELLTEVFHWFLRVKRLHIEVSIGRVEATLVYPGHNGSRCRSAGTADPASTGTAHAEGPDRRTTIRHGAPWIYCRGPNPSTPTRCQPGHKSHRGSYRLHSYPQP